MELGTTAYIIIIIIKKKTLYFDWMFSIQLRLVFNDPDWKLVCRMVDFTPFNWI